MFKSSIPGFLKKYPGVLNSVEQNSIFGLRNNEKYAFFSIISLYNWLQPPIIFCHYFQTVKFVVNFCIIFNRTIPWTFYLGRVIQKKYYTVAPALFYYTDVPLHYDYSNVLTQRQNNCTSSVHSHTKRTTHTRELIFQLYEYSVRLLLQHEKSSRFIRVR